MSFDDLLPKGRPFLQDLVVDGKDPKPIEYVLASDSMPDGLDLPPYLTVCVDVKRRMVNGYPQGYEFTNKATGKVHHTYYAWLLAENTPDNLELLQQIHEVDRKMRLLKRQRKGLWEKVTGFDAD
jgi:hypothetical protein